MAATLPGVNILSQWNVLIVHKSGVVQFARTTCKSEAWVDRKIGNMRKFHKSSKCYKVRVKLPTKMRLTDERNKRKDLVGLKRFLNILP